MTQAELGMGNFSQSLVTSAATTVKGCVGIKIVGRHNLKTPRLVALAECLRACLKTVTSAILADVESGFQPGGKEVASAKTM